MLLSSFWKVAWVAWELVFICACQWLLGLRSYDRAGQKLPSPAIQLRGYTVFMSYWSLCSTRDKELWPKWLLWERENLILAYGWGETWVVPKGWTLKLESWSGKRVALRANAIKKKVWKPWLNLMIFGGKPLYPCKSVSKNFSSLALIEL